MLLAPLRRRYSMNLSNDVSPRLRDYRAEPGPARCAVRRQFSPTGTTVPKPASA